jgi:hypothetical protein
MHVRPIAIVAFLVVATLFGCPPNDGPDGHTETCGEPGDTYTAGMQKEGDSGTFTVVLVAADPAPPDKGDNVLTLQILDDAGLPVDDATVVVAPFMPEHGHGTSPAEFDAPHTGSDGTYVSTPMDLFMGGLWDLVVQVTGSDNSTDEATFTFCIEA